MTSNSPLTKDEAIIHSKQFRKDADALLQRMKSHKRQLQHCVGNTVSDDMGEVIAQHVLSMRALEEAIMRQGMVLKYIGNPDPYPDSKNPENTVVNPTADDLKL